MWSIPLAWIIWFLPSRRLRSGRLGWSRQNVAASPPPQARSVLPGSAATSLLTRNGLFDLAGLALAAAADARDQDDATARFAQFFLATAVPDQGDSKLIPSCQTVASEFQKLERHRVAGTGSNAASGRSANRGFRLGDGE